MVAFDPEIIKELVAPAVMIPACGLLCLSTNARMMSVLERTRTLHRERVALYVDDPGEHPRRRRARSVRLEGVGWQTEHMLKRLGLMRATMMLLFTAIVGMLACSAGLGLSGLGGAAGAAFGTAAVAAFIAGSGCIAAAMGVSLFEMKIGLRAIRYEHERVLALDPDEGFSEGGGAI